jgi:DNA-binding NarL/FixJ family response regulator
LLREHGIIAHPALETRDSMKILVVDDHALIREALRGVLKKVRRGAVLLEAADGAEAMQMMSEQADIKLVLLDLTLPDRDGFSILAELRERYPTLPVVVLSGIQDRDHVVKAMDLGALGYIPKSVPREVMVGALQLIFSGGSYIPPVILSGNESSSAMPTSPRGDRPIVSPADVGLKGRDLDVLALMMKGKNNKIISRTLDVAETTVKHHVTAILKALKVTNRTEAVIAVNELGWELPASPNLE